MPATLLTLLAGTRRALVDSSAPARLAAPFAPLPLAGATAAVVR